MILRAAQLRPFTLLTTLVLTSACSSAKDSTPDGTVAPEAPSAGSAGSESGGSSPLTAGQGGLNATAGTNPLGGVSTSAGTAGEGTGVGGGGQSGASEMGGAGTAGASAGSGGQGASAGGQAESAGAGDASLGGAGAEMNPPDGTSGADGGVSEPESPEPETAEPTSPLPPTDDYSDFGPFETTSQANTGPDGTYTIVRPDPLGAEGFLHAPITFGPGTGMQVSQMMGLLERIASHGFVIIGRQLDGGPGDAATRMRMIGGLDWIIEQNSTPGSVFEGKLDVEHAVAMGYSVGGTGAVEIGGHAAIATVVSIHGHGAEGELRGPLLLMGGTEDVMNGGQSWLAPTYEASQTQTFFSLVIGADHGYIQGSHDGIPGGVETPAMIAWIRYWIYNDQEAKRYFEGDNCVMCDVPWSSPQRKNWP